ncbi:cilia- and flagella-associated protein 100-like [Harmonia axyridis]|uniref:cilia- and flagella-associated protein 100-like n=1 Tax=Harmonia axyridis TaxID=115357 RepID=UPI001E275DEF|nr:cilia- and flagella-associated protein 100-like [Harmonia axyridis]
MDVRKQSYEDGDESSGRSVPFDEDSDIGFLTPDEKERQRRKTMKIVKKKKIKEMKDQGLLPTIDDKRSLNVSIDDRSRESILSQKLTFLKRHKTPVKKRISSKLQNILEPKSKEKSKDKYFSRAPGVTTENLRDLHAEPSPFLYPKDLEEFAQKVLNKAWRNNLRTTELTKKFYERNNYRTRQQGDLLKRLYTEDPDVSNLKYIVDIDPDFFKIADGRPIPDKLNMRDYIDTVRDVLRTKIINGYREDDILLIEESLRLEQKMIDEIKENYQTYVNTFEEFLYNDHTYSMKLLRQSEQEAALAYEKYEEYKELSKEYGALRSILYNSEEKWRNCKMYQKFLYLVSPLSWRKQHDFYHFASPDEPIEAPEGSAAIFGKYRLGDKEAEVSLEDLIGQFLDDCATQREPELYFEDPEQLLDVFRFMELQNLNSLLHSEELAAPLEAVKAGMQKAERMFDMEILSLKESIDKLAGGIAWEEERAKYLEELAMELVNGEFRKLVVDDDILNLHVFVEDVYEARIGPNDANLSVTDMMRGIEIKYRNELLQLDKMPSEQVTKLEASCYAEEARILRIAEKASRKIVELERLTYRLLKAFTPPEPKISRELKWRSPPPKPPKPPPKIIRELTDFEQDYLQFFTEFCADKDDPIKYGIDINQPPTMKEEPTHEEDEDDEEETEVGDDNTEEDN